MIKETSEAVLMSGNGEQLEAIERVCDKRYLRGASVRDIINYLSGLRDEFHTNQHLIDGIDTLKSYWIARKA